MVFVDDWVGFLKHVYRAPGVVISPSVSVGERIGCEI